LPSTAFAVFVEKLFAEDSFFIRNDYEYYQQNAYKATEIFFKILKI